MQSGLKVSLLILIVLHLSTLILSSHHHHHHHHHHNISHLLTYSLSHHFHDDSSYPSPFLKEVLKAIAGKKKWDLGTITVSKLEKVRFGYSKSHTFPIRVAKKRDLVVRYSEQVGLWREFNNVNGSFEEIVNEVKSEAVLPPFIVDGPVQLLVHGGDDQLSLHLPMNTSFSGLKQIVVGEGITLEIEGAKEVSFALSYCNDIQSSASHTSKGRQDYWPLLQSFCPPVPPMHVVGPVNVTTFQRNLTGSTIDHNFLGKGTVNLKMKKCYKRNTYRQAPSCPVELSSRIIAAKHVLRTILGQKLNPLNHSLSFHKANMKASTFVRFQLELDREVSANDSVQGQLPEWRTKPARARVWFDVVARADDEKLKPVSIKPVKPFIGVDSTSWSYLFSNISISEFSSLLVPSHPLTLDVKW